MSLLDSLYDFETGESGQYTVTRSVPSSPVYDEHGRSVTPSSTTTFTINGSLQPLSGRDLLIMPEAQRAEETRWLYSDGELRTRGPTSDPDVVTVPSPNGDESWVVIHVERWEYPPEDEVFWKCQVSRINVP